MTTLTDLTREVIAELDADGGGFRTREATSLLFHRAIDGHDLPDLVTELCRLGAGVAVANNKPERDLVRRAGRTVTQADFADQSPGFDHCWLAEHAALDETSDAVRKRIIRLTLPEIRQVISLRRRKAVEMTATARRLQKLIDDYPEWDDAPEMTLGQVLGSRDRLSRSSTSAGHSPAPPPG
jgi:hypothetical protein